MLVGIPRWWQRFRDTWVTRFELFDSRSLSLLDDSCELPHSMSPVFSSFLFFFSTPVALVPLYGAAHPHHHPGFKTEETPQEMASFRDVCTVLHLADR